MTKELSELPVKIGSYSISDADWRKLALIARKIDNDKKKLSEKERTAIENAVVTCKGDIVQTEAMLRKLVLGLSADQLARIVPEMILIPSGTFKMGRDIFLEESSKPERQVKLSAFRISKYKVTNGQYRAYLIATGQRVPGVLADDRYSDRVMHDLTWYDAHDYCGWLSMATGRKFRLPTEAEWEYAARGSDGRLFPWGNDKRHHHSSKASPFGVMNLVKENMEWTNDWYAAYDPKDLIDPKGPKTGEFKVWRGGEEETSDGINLDMVPRTVTVRGGRHPIPRWYDFYGNQFPVSFRIAEGLK